MWLCITSNATPEQLHTLIQVPKMKLGPDEDFEFNPEAPRLAVLVSIEYVSRENLHTVHLNDFVITIARKGELGVPDTKLLEEAVFEGEEKLEGSVVKEVVESLHVMEGFINLNAGELPAMQDFFKRMRNQLATTLKTREPYAGNLRKLQEGLNYSECVAPKVQATLELLRSHDISVESVRKALRELQFLKNNAPPAEVNTIIEAMKKVMVDATQAIASAEVPESSAGTCYRCFKEIFA